MRGDVEVQLLLNRERDWERRERELTARYRNSCWIGVRNGLLLSAPFLALAFYLMNR